MNSPPRVFIPPIFLLTTLFFLFSPLLLVFGFSAPADIPRAATFEEDRERIEGCLEEAKLAYPLFSQENPAAARREILFYTCALRYSLPIWSGDFYFEGASLWAIIQQEWEILNANITEENTPRLRYLEEMDRKLVRILEEGDRAAFPLFYEEFHLAETKTDAEEVKIKTAELSLRILATEDGTLSPSENYLIYRIREINDSLRSGINRADPAREGESLTQKERVRMEALREYYLDLLQSDRGGRVVANEETLNFGEEVFTFLIFPATLLSLWEQKKRGSAYKILPCGLIFLTLFCLAASAGITLSANLFVPHSLKNFPVFFFSRLIPLPFSLSLFFRMLLRLLSLIPAFLLFHLLTKNGRSRKKRGVGLTLCLVLYQGLSIAFRVYLAQSPLSRLLPFGYWDLKGALMPSYPLSLFTPHPAAALGAIALLYGILLFFLFKKKKST